MSLISDALKEAQRERDARTGRRSGAAVADAFFPHAEAGSLGRHVTPKAAVIALVASLIVAGIVGILVARFVARVVVERHRVQTPAHVTPTPTAPAAVGAPIAPQHRDSAPMTAKAPSGALRGSLPPTRAATPTPSRTVVRGGTVVAAPQALKEETRPTTKAAPKIVPKDTSREAPRQAPAAVTSSQPPAAASLASVSSGGVRVVMDPAGTTTGDSLFAQAYTEHRRGNLDRAAALYERALQAHESSPELYNDYGALLASRANYTAAIPMYRLGLSTDEQNAKLWLNLADAYTAIGQHADALAAYSQVTQLDPLNAIAKMRLATEYQAIGDTASARRGFEEAVRLAPKDPTVHYAFGVFLQSQRDIRGAIRQYELFVDNAGSEYPQPKIDEVRNHIEALRRFDRD